MRVKDIPYLLTILGFLLMPACASRPTQSLAPTSTTPQPTHSSAVTSTAVPTLDEVAGTLRLAVADKPGRPSEPYVLDFVEQVNALSGGEMTIEPVWDAGVNREPDFEQGVIAALREGEYDLGLVGTRAMDTEDVTLFLPLQAPFLIDNNALADAVATSDIAAQMLDSLPAFGFVGLTLWPEDLRHPMSIIPGQPLLAPADFAGLDIRTIPSGVSFSLMEALGGIPVFNDSYQGAEAGLLQRYGLTGRPIATGNAVFFPKYQVLLANRAAFDQLSDAQQNILREAAATVQERAITERPGDAEAAEAWCDDAWGSIVLASGEQVAAFVEAAQPVVDQIQADPANAELVDAIQELKANVEPSPGAEACGAATQPPSEAVE